MDLILLGIVLIMSAWGIWCIRLEILKIQKDRKNRIIRFLDSIIHDVEIENHHGIQYWFDSQKQTFLGQGTSLEEIIDVVKHRFPDHIFLIQDVGGVSAGTDWKIIPFEHLKTFNISSAERK